MKYIDLHTDALTKTEGVFHITGEKLRAADCAVQCFAAFISDPMCGFSAACALADKFGAMCAAEGYIPLRRAEDFRADGVNALLTVEGGGAVEGDLEKLQALYARGVRLMTLLWNDANAIGFPNLADRCDRTKREARGLTEFGRTLVLRMFGLGMLVDVSHASDGVFFDVAALSRARGVPFVASHSNAQTVADDCRNLTDAQIGMLADCGGVIGLNFCADFLGGARSAEGQREAIVRHAAHILKVGGEDALALGSDFDGIPTNAFMRSASDMPRLFSVLTEKFGPRITEKIAFGNAYRVLGGVL